MMTTSDPAPVAEPPDAAPLCVLLTVADVLAEDAERYEAQAEDAMQWGVDVELYDVYRNSTNEAPCGVAVVRKVDTADA